MGTGAHGSTLDVRQSARPPPASEFARPSFTGTRPQDRRYDRLSSAAGSARGAVGHPRDRMEAGTSSSSSRRRVRPEETPMRTRSIRTIAVLFVAGVVLGWPVVTAAQAQAAKGTLTPAEARAIAKEAYIFTYRW